MRLTAAVSMRTPLLMTAALSVLACTGCDSGLSTDARTEVVFEGVRHVAEGPAATMTLGGGDRLEFDAPGGGTLALETSGFDRADVHFRLASFDGGVFAATVLDRHGLPSAELTQTLAGARYLTSASWTGLRTAVLEALDNGHVVFDTTLSSGAGALGTTDDAATSVHYDEKGHIVYDFEGASSSLSGATVYRPPTAPAMTVTHLRVRVEGGFGDVSELRLQVPEGATMTIESERFSASAPSESVPRR